MDGEALTAQVTAGRQAAEAGDWMLAGTANLRFHAQIVGWHGSPRLDQFFHGLMTEMRLGFLALPDPRTLHEPYLNRNEEICSVLLAGRVEEASAMLRSYLADAMEQIVAAVAAAA
jgi:DNA-binding GntR family transcriptional regulator